LIPSIIVAKLKRKPIIATINILIGDWSKDVYNPKVASIMEKTLFRLPYNKVITVSNYAKQSLIDDFGVRVPIEVVHNGVDIEKIDSIHAELPTHDVVLFVGRLTWFKHIIDLIDAMEILNRNRTITLRIIGDGQDKIIVEEKQAYYDWIEYLGKQGYEDTIKQMKKATMIVLPSTKDTYGMVVIEGLSCGLPVVAYNCAGPKEIIQHDVNGYLVEPHNITELAWQIGKAIENKTRLGVEGRKIVQAKFTWDTVVDNIERVYEQTCELDEGAVYERSPPFV